MHRYRHNAQVQGFQNKYYNILYCMNTTTKTYYNYVVEYKTAKENLQGNELQNARIKFLNIRQNILIKVLRLALLGYIHFDLHSGNILVTIDPNNFYTSCIIIDYGRVVNIKNSPTSYDTHKYFNYIINMFKVVKGDLNEDFISIIRHMHMLTPIFNKLFNSLNDMDEKKIKMKNNSEKIAFFKNICNDMLDIDRSTNLFLFKTNMAQMKNIFVYDGDFNEEELYGGDFCDKFFNSIKLSGETHYETDGKRFLKPNRGIFRVPSINAATINASDVVGQIPERLVKTVSKRRARDEDSDSKLDLNNKRLKMVEDDLDNDTKTQVYSGGKSSKKRAIFKSIKENVKSIKLKRLIKSLKAKLNKILKTRKNK